MLKIDISQIRGNLGEFQDFSLLFDRARIDLEHDWTQGIFRLDGTITNVGIAYQLRGKISFKTQQSCSRCLEPIDAESSIDISVEASDADDEIEEDLYNITEIVREAIVCGEPMKPLCKDDCSGLCPSCGINCNISTCACETDQLDFRFERLRDCLKS